MSKFETYLEAVRNIVVNEAKISVSSGVYYTDDPKMVSKLIKSKTEEERYKAFKSFTKATNKTIKELTKNKYSSVDDFIQNSTPTTEKINGYTFIKDSDMEDFITQQNY